MINSKEQSGLGIHCLPGHASQNIGKYGTVPLKWGP